MSTKRNILVIGILILTAVMFSACAGTAGETGPAGPAGETGPAGPAGADASALGCTECHDETSLISGKKQSWEASVHGTGTSYDYAGGRGSCAGCHSGAIFSSMIASGMTVGTYEGEGDAGPTKQDCRSCHQIHTTYSGADWALTTTDAVPLIAVEGETFDGGTGNLCANCHQPRRAMEAGTDGMFEITSTHWGPHHGPQSTMLLGLVGAGVEGTPSAHFTMIEDSCVTCHLGENDGHTFEPQDAACVACHGEDFDYSETQDAVDALAAELGALLEATGAIHDGHPGPGVYPEAVAQAAWNWIYVVLEDKSSGVHNKSFTMDMLEAGVETLEAYEVTVAAACEADAESADCAVHMAFVCLADAESDECADLTELYAVEEEAAAEH